MEIIVDEYDSSKYIEVKDDIIFCKGGDGTLIKAIHLFKHLNLPFFGLAAGTENFLMNTSEKIPEQAKYKKFNLIKITVEYSENTQTENNRELQVYNKQPITNQVLTVEGFNDICIGGDMSDWIEFNIHDKDRIIGKFKGSGVIFSTAQGSTGINKNNNGVILPLSSNSWSVTGDKTNRKINYVINPNKTSIHLISRANVNIWIDGKNKIIENVKKVTLSKGKTVTVIFNDYDNFKRKRRL